jgi:hypothetical protein
VRWRRDLANSSSARNIVTRLDHRSRVNHRDTEATEKNRDNRPAPSRFKRPTPACNRPFEPFNAGSVRFKAHGSALKAQCAPLNALFSSFNRNSVPFSRVFAPCNRLSGFFNVHCVPRN